MLFMKRVAFSVVFVYACLISVFSQQTTSIIPGSYIAGNATTAYQNEWIAFHNPASLATEKGISLQASCENKYLTKELFNEVFGIGIHTKYLNIGASLSHFGFADYHEIMTGISLARRFSDRLNIGIQANYYTVYFPQLQKYKGTVFAQVGIQCRVVKNFHLAFHCFNPTFSKIKSSEIHQKLPAIFSIGSLHIINEKVNWVAQIDKNVYGKWHWAVGVEYAPFKQFTVRVGGYGQDFVPTLGVGLHFGEFRFNLHCEYHLKLGLCTFGMLGYRF